MLVRGVPLASIISSMQPTDDPLGLKCHPDAVVAVNSLRPPKGHFRGCGCVLCAACVELASSRKMRVVKKTKKADSAPAAQPLAVAELNRSAGVRASEGNEKSQSASVRHEQVRSEVEEVKVEHSSETRHEKQTVHSDGSIETHISRRVNSHSKTLILEERVTKTVEEIFTRTSKRASVYVQDYITRLVECDVYNAHSLVVLQSHLASLSPPEPSFPMIPLPPVDVNLGPEERRRLNREHHHLCDRQRTRFLHEDHARLRKVAALREEMFECVHGLSGAMPGTARRSLEQLCTDGNVFAEHLRALGAASTDAERLGLNPVFARAVQEASPPALLTSSSSGTSIAAQFQASDQLRLLGLPDQQLRSPYVCDRLVVPYDAFASRLEAPTLALLVTQLLRENRRVDAELTAVVRHRLHANGVMTSADLSSAIRAFGEALLIEAQAASPDARRLDFVWRNAERLYANTLHYREDYRVLRGPDPATVAGVVVSRSNVNPLTAHMDQTLPAWRELPSMAEFASVGMAEPTVLEYEVWFDRPSDGSAPAEVLSEPGDEFEQVMKEMTLNLPGYGTTELSV